jgi:hypothetical protein
MVSKKECLEKCDLEFCAQNSKKTNGKKKKNVVKKTDDPFVSLQPSPGLSLRALENKVRGLFEQNTKYFEEQEEVGSKVIPEPPPPPPVYPPVPDPLYPSIGIEDRTALTPVYRGGQNGIYVINGKALSHSPGTASEGNGFVGGGGWRVWSGATTSPYTPTSYTQSQVLTFRQNFYYALYSTYWQWHMTGMKQLYDAAPPFANPASPTPFEVEQWYLKVIRHFRALCGLGANTLTLDPDLFKTSAIARERRNTQDIWDKYSPGVATTFGVSANNSDFGPCILGAGTHCGWRFVPTTAAEQSPYYNDGLSHDVVNWFARSEGIIGVDNWSNVTNDNTGWSNHFTLISRMIGALLMPGRNDGHILAFLLDEKVGFTFENDAQTIRFHWSGISHPIPVGYKLLGF